MGSVDLFIRGGGRQSRRRLEGHREEDVGGFVWFIASQEVERSGDCVVQLDQQGRTK